MGIGMGVPWFKVKDSFLSQGGEVFSSNFTFYGDMSARVMTSLRSLVDEIEIYSIDEAFLDISSFAYCDLEETAKEIKNLIFFVRKINDSPQLFLLEKFIKKGFLIADMNFLPPKFDFAISSSFLIF